MPLGAALLLASCSQGKPDEGQIARVGALSISRDEFHEKLSEVAPEYQNYVLTANGRKQFLEILIREKLILAAAKEDHVAATEEFGSEVEKLKAEQRRRLKEFEEYLLTKLWIDGLRQKGVLKVTDEEVRAYHSENPREVQLRHILVSDARHGEELLKKLRRAGSNFAQAAKEESLDQDTASKGGKLPPLLRGEVLPELEEVAFKMKTNETVGLIQSKFGYHILRKETDKPVSLEETRERIRRLLEKQKLDRYLARLQERYPVEIFDANLK